MRTRCADAAREFTACSLEGDQAPVFYPSEEEFEDFAKYVTSIAPQCADFGIAKIVPPMSWHASRRAHVGRRDAGFTVKAPIEQHVVGTHGLYQLLNQERLRMTLERFERQAVAIETRDGVAHLDEVDIPAQFWKDISDARPPLYGSDLDGSFCPSPSEHDVWNLRSLPDLLRLGPSALKVEGTPTPLEPRLNVGS